MFLKCQNDLIVERKNYNDKIIVAIISLAIISTFGTQIEFTTIASKFEIMMNISWIMALFLLIYFNKCKVLILDYCKFYILNIIIFLFSVYLGHLIIGEYIPQIFKILFICIMMYEIGSLVASRINKKQIEKILKVYCISCLILSIYIYLTKFATLDDWMNTMENVYHRKNSAGQLISVSIIIHVMLLNTKNRIKKCINYISIFILSFVLILIQCRTAILGLFVVIIYKIVILSSKKLKGISITIFTLIFLVTNKYTFAIIEKALYLNKYRGASLDKFSSGRLTFYTEGLAKWSDSIGFPFFGLGNYYVDNFYINIIISVGILGFIPIILIVLKRFKTNFKSNYFKNKDNSFVIELINLLSIFYIIESMLEGFPPLGPGACSFIFWILCGYVDGIIHKSRRISI